MPLSMCVVAGVGEGGIVMVSVSSPEGGEEAEGRGWKGDDMGSRGCHGE